MPYSKIQHKRQVALRNRECTSKKKRNMQCSQVYFSSLYGIFFYCVAITANTFARHLQTGVVIKPSFSRVHHIFYKWISCKYFKTDPLRTKSILCSCSGSCHPKWITKQCHCKEANVSEQSRHSLAMLTATNINPPGTNAPGYCDLKTFWATVMWGPTHYLVWLASILLMFLPFAVTTLKHRFELQAASLPRFSLKYT